MSDSFNSFGAFDNFVEMLVRERDLRRGLERRVRQLEKERDDWREAAQPGFKKRELDAAIDGEIRLLREQG